MREYCHRCISPNFQKDRPALLKNKQTGRFNRRVPKLLDKVFSFIQFCTFPLFIFLTDTGSAETFQELRKSISASPSTQPEETIMQFLKIGLEENKPTQAIMETEKWLRQNLPKDEMLLYKAAQAAELSGDWKSAVAYYQQYLEKADLQSDTADEAVYVIYSILIHQLKDTSAAYSFSRN
jgi:TolA-binding protein